MRDGDEGERDGLDGAEAEAKALLRDGGLEVPAGRERGDVEEAVAAAGEVG